MTSLSMEISTFRNVTTSAAKPMVWNESKFLATFAKHKVRLHKDGKLFSPATFKKNRSNKNFICASGLCLDFDHGQPTPESALALFPGTLAAYYSTHSNSPESLRFRVVLPLSRPVNAAEHVQLAKGIKSIIHPELMECIDKSCFERSRSHYLPSCPPENQAIAFAGHQKGALLDADHFIRLGEAIPDNAEEKTIRKATKSAEAPPIASTPAYYTFTDPKTGEVIDLALWAAQNANFDIVAAINRKFALGPVVDGKQHIVCPFSSEHSDSSPDLATFVSNSDTTYHPCFTVHCMHSHCSDRDRLEFLQVMLEKEWLPADMVMPATLELRNPLWVTLQVKEILSSTEWAILSPKERRIAWDLQFFAWQSDDGTIEDNDWKISKFLGLSDDEWLKYRETLNRAGWLIENNGRLTNSIVKREFDLAQLAYSKKCAGGRKGGLASQEKRRTSA